MELEKFKGVDKVSMQFQNIIDEEDIMLDSHKLAEFNKTDRLRNEIDNLVNKFVDDNVDVNDYDTTSLLYRFALEIKYII